MGKRKITMTVDERVFSAFKRLCRANGMKVSSRVELLMRDFAANGPQQRLTAPDDEPQQDAKEDDA